MPKLVTFNLGPTVGISARQLTITRMHRAGDDATPAAASDADAGAVASVTIELDDNIIFQAVLVDTMTAGEVRPNQVIQFNTASLLFLGPRASQPDGSEFYVLHMEDLSSSSSASSVSSSSSESSSESSASSVSSVSSSSVSSESSSASSSSASSASSSSASSSSQS